MASRHTEHLPQLPVGLPPRKNRHVDFLAQDPKRLRPVQHCVRSQIRKNWHTHCRSPLRTPEAVRPRDGNACVLVHSISAGICRTFLRRAIVRIYFSDHARTGGVIDACIETARLDDDSVVDIQWACGGHVVDTFVDGGFSACLNSHDKSLR